MEGLESRASSLWQEVANSEMRIWLMRELVRLGIGLNEIESFNIGIINKLRSEEMKGKAEMIRERMARETLGIKLLETNRGIMTN